MKNLLLVVATTALISACNTAPQPEKPIGMANPASVYCAEVGGKTIIKKTPEGDAGYCQLPSGEVVDEWDYFRKNHPEK
ncbi:DUF333 domain-containing protein [Acinetobacter sp.]|uniref:putative hemolysin n=1 Tax=Acinetobacter sp. TaxID=472 RepID=UPI0035B25408